MGMYYSAAIIVGLHRSELDDVEDDVIESMDQCPPYYDGGDEAVIGVMVVGSDDYSALKFAWDQPKADAAAKKFKELTGKEGQLYLTPVGY